jgi:RimJ/RimL family protein N-acetyltransferase
MPEAQSLNLVLLPFDYEHLQFRVELFSHPEVRKLMRVPENMNIEDTNKWLKRVKLDKYRKDFVVASNETGLLYGCLGYKAEQEGDLPSIYIAINPRNHGSGIGYASMNLLIDWMKVNERYVGCWLEVDEANTAAIRIYQKLGFRDFQRHVGRMMMKLDFYAKV